jgi:hypothetical protein
MRYCAFILLLFFHNNLLQAQPVKPCLNFPIVVDAIEGVDMQSVKASISHIGIKKTKPGEAGCNQNDACSFDAGCYDLSIATQSSQDCNYATRYSNVTGKLYLERYNMHNPVLTIERNNKKMYIIFNRMTQFERDLFKHDSIISIINNHNRNLNVLSYYMYIAGIKFLEGVYFLKENYSKPSSWIKKTTISNLYDPDMAKQGEALVYSPYEIGNGTGYYKTFPGSFSKKQVIELILENQPIENSLTDAFNFAKWKLANGFIKQNTAQAFAATIKTLENTSRNSRDLLITSSKELTERELFERYVEHKKNDFFSILDNDYKLRKAFCSYFKRKNEVKKNKDLSKQNNYKINKQKLKAYYLKEGNHYKEFIDFMTNNQYKVNKEKLQVFVTSLNRKAK